MTTDTPSRRLADARDELERVIGDVPGWGHIVDEFEAAVRAEAIRERDEAIRALLAFAYEADPAWEDWSEKDWRYADPHWQVVRAVRARFPEGGEG